MGIKQLQNPAIRHSQDLGMPAFDFASSLTGDKQMKHYLITGTSSGLGAALAKALCAPGQHIVGLARRSNPALATQAANAGAKYSEYQFDLTDLAALPSLAQIICEKIAPQAGDSLYLINNAGMIAPLKRAEDAPAQMVLDNIAVNLAAPMLLCSAFIKAFGHFAGDKRIVNISSGAGRNAIAAWSSYCATKAGIDRFTQALALEQATASHPVTVVAYAPGVLDTAMQTEIRASKPEDFPLVGKFISFKEKGNLRSAEEVALAVIAILNQAELENGALLHI
jgi:benzil reductase ((S)-benzoin forming)